MRQRPIARILLAAFAAWGISVLPAADAEAAGIRRPRRDARADIQRSRRDALDDENNQGGQGPAQQEPDPPFSAQITLPFDWVSNAALDGAAPRGSTAALPQLQLQWSQQPPGGLPLRFTAQAGAVSERYARYGRSDADTLFIDFELRRESGNDDQEFQPYIRYSPLVAFTPGLGRRTGARQDYALGVEKVFNFTRDLRRVGPVADSGAATSWALTVGLEASRRTTDADPNSAAASANLGLEYTWSPQWRLAADVTATHRWYDPSATSRRGQRREWLFVPLLTLEFTPPAEWFGAPGPAQDRRARRRVLAGVPEIALQVGYARLSATEPGAGFRQWLVGPVLTARWFF